MRGLGGGLNTFFSILILLIIIRTLTLVITLRSTLQNEKMSEVQGKIAEINGKYKGATDMVSRQRKQLELQEVYKKHKIKPFAPIEQMMITLPIYTIIHRLISTVRPIKATHLFNV
jgi:YidC/Oxa1 family membrane protein insertase